MCIDVSEYEFVLQTEFDFGCSKGYFSGYEVFCAAGAFVVKAYRVAEEQSVRFSVDFDELICEGFGCTIWGVRVNGGEFILGGGGWCSEDFAA